PEPAAVALGGAKAQPLPGVPADAVALLTLPALSGTEISELVDRLALRLNASHGYADADWALADAVPAPPDGVKDTRLLGRLADGRTHVLRFGYRRFLSQPAQLWVFGGVIDDGHPISVNPDLANIAPAVTEMLAAIDELRGALTPRQLESKLIQLSYVDAGTAIAMLEGLGITTMAAPSDVPGEVAFDQLPYVVQVPDPAAKDVGLIGDSTARGGEFGLSLTPSLASPLSENNVAAPMTQLLVMFHPARPEQYSRVRSLIDDFVDRPARQIFVEGLVLEISEDGLRDLGIEWELAEGPVFWRFGSPNADGQTDTADIRFDDIDFHRVFTRNFAFDWSLEIRALLRNGKAEILSRPSVLTLNNRQSTIRVGQDIPIATSQEGVFSTSNKIAFTFKYLPTGILLNIRPRVNELGTEVSMLVDTIVSSVVPGADFEIRSVDGDLLASAPTVATRRVQTYARIRNNTPFIIGGLVSRVETQMQDKVPFLGDLPIIGAAFRAERSESEKREVIIVLTPYVLPDDQIVQRSLPRNDDRFDSFGQQLFRDSYRIRGDDVFDLSFLFENRRLTEYQDLARSVIRRNFRLGEREPFRSFAGDRIPGEDILVTRMIYEVAKRQAVADDIDRERIILFERQRDVGGYDVRFLDQMMVRLGGGPLPTSFFRRMPGKAIAITYSYDRESRDIERLATEPIPELALVDCADRDAWSKLLWELNQPENGRARYTVLIHDESDLIRLQRAIALKRIVGLNGGPDRLLLRNYTVGKMLLMPDFQQDQVHVVDADVARYFFRTEHYYAATIKRLEDALRSLDSALRDPEVRAILAERAPNDG
ncbi:MAG: hypothetical protein KJO43_02175, partial [Phycisphaerae bacterium]|nr:hypothetical protein [Phycisphaerae bacterium]